MNPIDDRLPKRELFDELREKAESILHSRGLGNNTPEAVEAQKLFHELQIHHLELEMQNDELNIVATELEIQRAKFSSLFDLAPIGYAVVNTKGVIQDINQTGSKLFGLSKHILLKKPLPGFIYADDVTAFYNFFRKLFSETGEHSCQLRMFKLGQSIFYAQLNGICIMKAGKDNCYITITDITEKKIAELELKRAKHRLDVALSASLTGTWEINMTSGEIYLDDFAHSIFGLKAADFDGKYPSFLSLIDESDRGNVDSILRVAMVRENDFNVGFSVRTPGGKLRYIDARGQVIYDGDVNRRFTGTITDITEKKLLELETLRLKEGRQQEIRAASLQAEENARRSISESLHDSVGQILYAMKLDLQQMKNRDDEGYDKYYKQVNQLLDQSIQDIRNLSFELAPSILKDFGLKATLEEMARRLSSDTLSIKVSVAGLGELELNLATNIYRIIQELVNNSIKHGHATQVDIEAKRADEICVKVTDNGKGFTRWKKAAVGEGTGLSSVRNRVELYKGSVDIKSVRNKGTTVFIHLKHY
ncbi:MAG: PAS domain S-box protein [Bacteroidetes bacterium]|nr:PAS domain S-box protein [Bacteroidota bacterium]